MKAFAVLAAAIFARTPPVIAQQKDVPHASCEQAIQLLRREGVLHNGTRVNSANWNGQSWLISLQHPDRKITNWTVDAGAENYSYVCPDLGV
jgi:hypothetical protein